MFGIEEITINQKYFFDKFYERWNELEKYLDRCEAKQDKWEEAGDEEKAKRWELKYDKARAEQEGMLTVLRMLGYTMIWNDGRNVIVRK